MGQETHHTPYLNVTPAKVWTPNFDTDDLNYRLLHQLTIKKTEEAHRRTVAKTTQAMAEGMGLSFEEFKQLETLDSFFGSDRLSKKAQGELRIELEGSHTGHWKGWKHALQSDFSIPVDWYECDTVKDVRIQMARYWVDKVRAQNSRKQLSRLLGCSETTVDNIFTDGDVVSVKQYDGKTYIKPSFEDLRTEFKSIIRNHGASIVKVGFRVESETNWQYAPENYAPRYYKDHRHEIKSVWIQYIVPSFQYLKSVASWDLNWQRFIVAIAHYMTCKHADILTEGVQAMPDAVAEIKPVTGDDTPRDNTPAEDKTTLSMQHVYTRHTPQFCRDQMALRVQMATGYKVIGQSVVEEYEPFITPFYSQSDANRFKQKNTRVIFMPLRGKRDSGLLQFITDNKAPKLACKSHEVFGKDVEDYDEELNAEYKAEREREIIDLVSVPDFDMPQAPPQQLEIVASEPQPVAVEPTIDPTRHKLFIEFCNKRYEREHATRKRLFARIA